MSKSAFTVLSHMISLVNHVVAFHPIIYTCITEIEPLTALGFVGEHQRPAGDVLPDNQSQFFQ